jgi:hypothetical protein
MELQLGKDRLSGNEKAQKAGSSVWRARLRGSLGMRVDGVFWRSFWKLRRQP